MKTILAISLLLIIISSCASDNEEALFEGAECNDELSLADDISPIINTNCALANCHAAAQSPNLSTKAGIISNAARIRAVTQNGSMPPSSSGKSLSEAQVKQIACWVDNGAQNN